MNVVFDKEVDFAIKVSDTDGCGNDCLGKEWYQTSIEKGLKCEAYVGNSACVDSHSGVGGGDISACLRWDNFYDDSKIGSSKWYLSITNSMGQIVPVTTKSSIIAPGTTRITTQKFLVLLLDGKRYTNSKSRKAVLKTGRQISSRKWTR